MVTPFFEVDIELEAPQVVLHPSLDEIQVCINRSAQAILRCFKIVKDWTIDTEGPRNVKAFFDRITKDIGEFLLLIVFFPNIILLIFIMSLFCHFSAIYWHSLWHCVS